MDTNIETLHDRLKRYRALLSLNTDEHAAAALRELIAGITAQLGATERSKFHEQSASASGSASPPSCPVAESSMTGYGAP